MVQHELLRTSGASYGRIRGQTANRRVSPPRRGPRSPTTSRPGCMIAFVALYIYLDRAGTVSLAPATAATPNFANSRSSARRGCMGCLAAPAGICATLERATVATMVLQTIRNIRSRRRKSRCLHTKERGGRASCPTVAAAAAWADGAQRLRPTCRRLVAARVARRAAAASGKGSVGAARPSDFDAHLASIAKLDQAAELLPPVVGRLQQMVVDSVGADWAEHWYKGLPDSCAFCPLLLVFLLVLLCFSAWP